MQKLKKENIKGWIRFFCPNYKTDSITDITPEFLKSLKKKLLFLDVDSTIAGWNESLPAENIAQWMENLKNEQIDICLISNTHRVARLQNIAQECGVGYVTGILKPSIDMHQKAISMFPVKKDEIIMIGDQLLTDVLSSNRFGIDCIWVKPLPTGEFVGTKVTRLVENVIVGLLKKNRVF